MSYKVLPIIEHAHLNLYQHAKNQLISSIHSWNIAYFRVQLGQNLGSGELHKPAMELGSGGRSDPPGGVRGEALEANNFLRFWTAQITKNKPKIW